MSITVQYNAAYNKAKEEAKEFTVEKLVFKVDKIVDSYGYTSIRDAEYKALLEEMISRLMFQTYGEVYP